MGKNFFLPLAFLLPVPVARRYQKMARRYQKWPFVWSRALTKNQKYKSRRDAVRAEKYLNHRRRWLYCLPRGHPLREEVPAVQGSLSEFIVVDR